MKLRIILVFLAVAGISFAIGFQEPSQKITRNFSPTAVAQIPSGNCLSFQPLTDTCGDNPTCGIGEYTETANQILGP